MCAILGRVWEHKPKARKRLRQPLQLCTVMDELLTKKENEMSEIKHNAGTPDGTGNMLRTASSRGANRYDASLLDYAIKAIVGGAIWMAFKVGGEDCSDKIRKK